MQIYFYVLTNRLTWLSIDYQANFVRYNEEGDERTSNYGTSVIVKIWKPLLQYHSNAQSCKAGS